MPAMDAALAERARAIRLLILDVDGVLTDGKLFFDHAGNEMQAFNARDGMGIKALQQCGVEIAILSGRTSAAVTHRMAQLGIEHVYQGQVDKLDAFMQLLKLTAVDAQQVCFVGDDWIDLPVLVRVGLAVSVADAETRVKQQVHWVTQRNGGEGAVREICNLIMTAKGQDKTIMNKILAS